MYIVAWNIYRREAKRVVKGGARYIWKIEYNAITQRMTFTGQARQSVTASLSELAV